MNELKDVIYKAIEAKQQHVNQLLAVREKAIDTIASTHSELQFANASLEKLHADFKELHELEYNSPKSVEKRNVGNYKDTISANVSKPNCDTPQRNY